MSLGRFARASLWSRHCEPYRNWTSDDVLGCVERWAGNLYAMIRETGIVFVGKQDADGNCESTGRLDALLVPVHRDADSMSRLTKEWFWDRVKLIGVEVKVSRSDFLHGLKSGQFERYYKALSALYVATPRGVCKSSELPAGIGHLVCPLQFGDASAICARRPTYRNTAYSADVPWRILFHVAEKYRKALVAEQVRVNAAMKRTGESISRRIQTALLSIADAEIARTTAQKMEARP